MSNYVEVEDIICVDRLELLDNQYSREFIEEIQYPEIAVEIALEGDLLMDKLYSEERGLRVEFLGIQLDELWSFVGNKENKQWVWLALNPSNRQIIAFHIGGRVVKMPRCFTQKFPHFLRKMRHSFLTIGKHM